MVQWSVWRHSGPASRSLEPFPRGGRPPAMRGRKAELGHGFVLGSPKILRSLSPTLQRFKFLYRVTIQVDSNIKLRFSTWASY